MFGGRGGTKTQTFADLFIQEVDTKGVKVACFREHQNTLDDSVHAMLEKEIKRMKVSGFKITDNKIRHRNGGGFKFRGLAINTFGVKSFEGFKYFWVEEGQFLSETALQVLIPTLREAGSELWISMNPLFETDAVYKRYIKPNFKKLLKDRYYEDDDVIVIWTNYDENPWFPKELEMSRQWDFNNLPFVEYRHIWLGYTNPKVDDAIIKSEWIEAAVDAHLVLDYKPRGMKIVAHDPSDEGDDDKGLIYKHGSVILEAQVRPFGDCNEGLDWALDYAMNHNADLFTVDIGGAMGIKRQIAGTLRGKHTKYQLFNGSEQPYQPDEVYDDIIEYAKLKDEADLSSRRRSNRDTFKNKRSQFYAWIRDALFNSWRAVEHGIYIDPDDMLSISSKCTDLDLLKEELAKIPRKYTATGLFQLKTKQEMRALKIPSPNLADPAMMSFYPYESEDDKPLTFVSHR